jgi:glutamate carboxypeptidase
LRHSNDAEYVDISSIEPRLYLLTRLIMDIAAGRAGIAATAAR